MHWLVQMAKQAGWPGAEPLAVETDRPTADAWPVIARALGFTSAELATRVAARLRLEVADAERREPHALRLLPADLARRYHVFPLAESDRELTVATAEPLNAEAEQAIGFASGRRVTFQVAAPEWVDELVNVGYGPLTSGVEGLLDRVSEELADAVAVVEESGPEPVRADEAADPPVIRLTNYIIHTAIAERASDIHIAPTGPTASVRLRIDGVLRHQMQLPLGALPRVISRVKVLGRMDIADRIRPQDGRTRVTVGGRIYDLRISVVPTRDAEKAVIRILDPSAMRALEELELPEPELARLRQLLGNREGIVFLTGPTGSGKTTTLYAALRELSTQAINITTVEDPVEYELAGITQIQVEPKRGVTFASALRAILRQDPDVILVGEIRDPETAQIAVQAAMTGHLVLATLHTNDAIGIVPRLLDLGLDRPGIVATVRGAVSQRLVRRVCPDCGVRISGALTEEEQRLAALHGVEPIVRAVGCERCGNTGYRGRVAEGEVLSITPGLASLIADGANAIALQKAAIAAGLRPLHDLALERVRAGVTTLQEVERVLGERADDAAPAPAAAPLAEGAASSERARILVVEDEPIQARLVRSVLERSGFDVAEAADGQVAWSVLVGEGGISLVLTDLRMPNMDGGTLLDRMRGNVGTAAVPVVVLTGSDDEGLEVELLERGADDYLRKPVDGARLAARVRSVLRRVAGAGGGSLPGEVGAAPVPAADPGV